MRKPKRLYVMRHAKSSWDDASLPDHDRTLSDRGRRVLPLLAAYVAAHELRPELVLCSSAQRTRETLLGLGLGADSEVLVEQGLYGATSGDLIERLHAVPAKTRSVLLVGHNPALQTLVLTLAGRERGGRGDAAEGLEEIRRKLPTGALVTLATDHDWAKLRPGRAELVDYVRPKTLQFGSPPAAPAPPE